MHEVEHLQNDQIYKKKSTVKSGVFQYNVTPNTLLYLPLDGDLIDKSSHQNN